MYKSIYSGTRCVWCIEKRLQNSKISTTRENQGKTENSLLCMGYNLNKLHAKIQSDRLKSHLFVLKTA